MRNKSSLKDRILALVLSIVLVLGMLPANVIAQEIQDPVAKIGDTTYVTMEKALAAVPKGTNKAAPQDATTITLLRDAEYAFDVGTSNGSTTMNLKLDLSGHTLTLAPSVGSVGTKSSGIRVLAYSKLEIVGGDGGTIVCSSKTADNVKVGIANYGTLTLTDVAVKRGDLTLYTINNRGALTLNGKTSVEGGKTCAITNDPYDLYYTTNVPASVTCNSEDVVVESMLVERYVRTSENKGGVELNISAGTFGKITEDANTSVPVNYNVTGGTICVANADELAFALDLVKPGSAYTCPEKPVTIKLLDNMAGSFDIGTSNGTAPKNVVLDMNGKTLTLKPGIGSTGTKTNGIRVLAYSKLTIIGGKGSAIVCSSEEADKVKVGIANYSNLILEGVDVLAGAQTLYTINNRGALTLKGATKVTADKNSICAITNDPYDLYYTTNKAASLTCDSDDVVVDSVLVERYARNSANQGGVELNISAGYFGDIKEDSNTAVPFKSTITGGKFGFEGIDQFCEEGYKAVADGNGGYVVKSEQKNFGFDKEIYTVTFGADYNKFTANLKNAVGQVTYSIVEGTDVATFDEEDPSKLIILKAGTVKVKAEAAGDATHVAAEDTYTLVVNPAYADVHSYSGGTVTDSGAANTVVSINNAVLEWFAKDDSIGRPQDGWWVGIKIVAPDGVDLSKAVYQRRSGGTYDNAEVIPFVPENDRYLSMWGLITAEYLESFSNSGKKLNYVWRFSWDGDDVYEQTIAITIDPAGITLKQSGFAFDIDKDETTYGVAYQAKEPIGGQASKITYSVNDKTIAEIDETSGVLTIHKAGTIIITATKSGDHYQNIDDSYTLVIKPADRPDFKFEESAVEITYGQNGNKYTQAVQGTQPGDALKYEIVDELYEGSAEYNGQPVNVADIDVTTGELTIYQSGVVKIKVTAAATDCYNGQSAEYTLTVKKAAQSDFKFKETVAEITYGEKYTQAVQGALGTGDLEYKIIDEQYEGKTEFEGKPVNVADIDSKTGDLTIYQSGVIKVQATKAGDVCYEAAEPAEYTLTVKKAELKWELEDARENIPLTYGTTSYTNKLTLSKNANVDENTINKPVYTADIFAADKIGAVLDSSTGELTFGKSDGKVGELTVQVDVAEDVRYKAFSKSYTLKIEYLPKPTANPTTDGSKKGSDWYTGNVVIKAPDGYTIADKNELGTEFKKEIPYEVSGETNTVVYLKNAQGYITDAIPVDGIKLDPQAPAKPVITYKDADATVTIEKLLEKLTFGIYEASTDKLEVVLSAEDEISGVAQLIFFDGKQEFKFDFEDAKTVEQKVTIAAQFRNKISLKVIDVAGNESLVTESNEYIVLDTTDPTLLTPSYTFASGEHNKHENGIIYTQDAVTIGFTINEANFDLAKLPVLTVNDKEQEVSWTRVENTDNWQATSFTLTEDGDYVVMLKFADASKNDEIHYVQEFRIDSKNPVITITDKADSSPFKGEISKVNKTAVITVEEHNFLSNEINVEVIAKDILDQNVAAGVQVGGQIVSYKEYAKTAQWTALGNDVYTLELPLDEDAVYDIKVNYEDPAGNAAAAEDKLTVDKTPVDPSSIKLTYEKPVSELILENITFGFYKAKTEVTVTVEDMTSGVASIVLTYTRAQGASTINKEAEEKSLVVNQNGNVFTAVYQLDANADGFITKVVVTDNAGHTTENDRNESDRLVVDKKIPGITVTYEAGVTTTPIFRDAAKQPVETFAAATQVYYNGDAKATIAINEANFFEGVKTKGGNVVHNVLIKVTKTDDAGNVTVTEYLPKDAGSLVGNIDVSLKRIEWTHNGDVHTVEIPFADNGDYVLEIEYADFSGYDAAIDGGDGKNGTKTYLSKTITVDETAPQIEVVNPQKGAILNPTHTAQLKITEHNFDPKDVELSVIAKDITGKDVAVGVKVGNEVVDYKTYAKTAKWTDLGNDVHILDVEFANDAIYEIKVNYSDLAGIKADEKTDTFIVDKTAPYDIQITYEKPISELLLQTVTFGFYQAKTLVTVTVKDDTSGVKSIDLTYIKETGASEVNKAKEEKSLTVVQDQQNKNVFTATYEINAQTRGNFSALVVDEAGNDSSFDDQGNVIITDTINPDIKISYTGLTYEKGFRDVNDDVVAEKDAVRFYYKTNVTATITINEANFFEGVADKNGVVVHKATIKVTKIDDNDNVTVTEYLPVGAASLVDDPDEKKNITWTSDGDVHTTSILLDQDGDYVLEMKYQDFSGNDAEISEVDSNSGTVNYMSRNLIVDTTKPEIVVSYDDVDSARNENCYKNNRIATIAVTEHNFKAEEFVLDVETTNLLGNITVADYEDFAKNPANWSYKKADGTLTKDAKEAVNANEHILQLTFSADATYTIDMSYTDMAGNAADDFVAQTFVVDHTAADNIKITYSTPVFEKLIETLSFGFYKANVVVTVTAEDLTAGVDYFELTYTRDEKATDAHTGNFMQKLEAKPGSDAKTFTASYTVPAQARGSYSVKVIDRAGNASDGDDKNTVIVTDTVSPQIKVDYAAKDAATKVHFVDSQVKDVDTFDKAANAFFGGDVVTTITVNEANFFEGKKTGENNNEIGHELIIKVTKTDDNGNVTVIEYLPAGAAQLVDGAKAETIQWTTNGDTHTANITFADDGDYVLEITYADFSQNDAQLSGNDGNTATKTYTSKIITVDETAPIINVTYGNTNVLNTIDGRKYFDKVQSAVITVTEHNFRAEDIAAVVTAKDVVGADVAVADFAAQLANAKNWKHEGNVHTAELKYTVDANYTFDIDFVDLAINASADYQQDLFTVDTTAPANLKVAYSTSVLEQIKESITFGYYNAMMTVTITAEDDTSGIYHFAYSYIKGKDVSGINAELLDEAIKEAEITFDGKLATATFTIPKMVLGDDNQFNGTVEFVAYDRSEVNTELKDSKVIVVDNITPTSKITYNAPVQNANGISYYDGKINATIEITEANFDSADVVVTVTKDGKDYPINVSWKDNSVDVHTGTFTLTEDGDYFVSVQYKDKSGNEMVAYKSNELTLDATAPTIKVSNIKANSANKDEKYSFVITFNDTNLDASALKPVLKAVKQTADGIYTVVEIDLGEAKTVVSGQTYTYTVDDLPDDGLYTLTCQVEDMSKNGMSQVILDDGKSYEQVQFSINRKGSAFGYGNKFSEELVGQYYIYSVNEDVVIVEVNVDPIEEYKVTLNGKELVAGTDYTTTQTSNNGEWSKRTYTIKKELFAAEGEYNIIVSSKDKAETTAFSDIKNLSLAFVVDQTKPAMTITGLEAGGRYQTDAQTVILMPTDEGGRLNSLKVIVLDSNGNPLKDETGADISVRFEMSGEELLKHLEENGAQVTFTVPEGLNNQVKIICNDCAVNAEGATNEYSELFEKVTVSQNRFVIFYANTPLFVGTIVGILAVAALIVFLIKRKTGKKNKQAKA